MKSLNLLLTFLISVAVYGQEYYMLVGTYDSPLSEGIYVYKFELQSGKTTPVSFYKTPNASFVTVSPDEKYVYAVAEKASNKGVGGDIIALAFNKQNGLLTLLNSQASGGDHPCHVELDKTGKWLFAANYSSGSLSVFKIQDDGRLGKPNSIKHSGSGKHPQRQKAPHVHGCFISPDNKQLLVTDLGIDKIMMYEFDVDEGTLKASKQPFVSTVAGSGPRSLCYDVKNKMVFSIEELTGTISAYRYKKHKLIPTRRTFTNPKGDTSFAGSAHIALSNDNSFLYASNRGDQNTITVYRNDRGELRFIQRQPVLGKAPRHFSLDPSGKFLLCGNQNSNEIVIFNRSLTGELSDSGKRISIGKPVCIKWINTQ